MKGASFLEKESKEQERKVDFGWMSLRESLRSGLRQSDMNLWSILFPRLAGMP